MKRVVLILVAVAMMAGCTKSPMDVVQSSKPLPKYGEEYWIELKNNDIEATKEVAAFCQTRTPQVAPNCTVFAQAMAKDAWGSIDWKNIDPGEYHSAVIGEPQEKDKKTEETN